MSVSSVVLTALAILVAFLGESYVKLLRESVGVRTALRPYRTISRVAGVLTIAAFAGALAWKALIWWGQVAELSLVAGLAVWAVWGTVELVRLTVWHGELRSRMPEILDEARAAREERKQGTAG